MRVLVVENLWDEDYGAYVNRYNKPNSSSQPFLRRLSPTSFYALLLGEANGKGPPEAHASRMVTDWLTNPKHFCISPSGNFSNNTDDCYWGLPSISADDPAFPKLGYWRGFVWGPMAMLTYWGLDEYAHVAEVKQSKEALCKQMNSLMLSQWHRHGHICENYSPHKDASECTGQPFYHWGALTGFISLLDSGYY